MRLTTKKNMAVLDIGVDWEGSFSRVSKVYEYFDDDDKKSCYIIEFRKAIGFLNLGTLLGAILGLALGLAIGLIIHTIPGLLLALLFCLPILMFGGSVYFQAMSIGGEKEWAIVPLEYKTFSVNGRAIIPIFNNEPIPYLQLDGKYPKISIAAIKLAASKHLFASEIRHLKKNNAGILLMVMVIVIVLAGIGYLATRKVPAPVTPSANVTVNQTIPTQVIR